MAVKLNRRAYDYAKELIEEGQFISDARDAWSENQPTTQQENDFLEQHGFDDYARWHLGLNEDKPARTKGHYEFPYGDFKNVHRGGVITAESRAGQYRHFAIEQAAHRLLELIDARAGKAPADGRAGAHGRPAIRTR